jgi:hypothetical protein
MFDDDNRFRNCVIVKVPLDIGYEIISTVEDFVKSEMK